MRKRRIKLLVALVVLGLPCLLAIGGCEGSLFTQFEHWDHAITSAEFAPHATLACLVYTYEDARFNSVDLFDMYMVTTAGVSDFDSTYDETLGEFLYQPVYASGSVTWLAHPGADTVLAGETLRFYRVWK